MAVEFGTKNQALADKKWAVIHRLYGLTYDEIQFEILSALTYCKELRELSADELDLLIAHLDGVKKKEEAA